MSVQAFLVFDQDKSGYLNLLELQKVLCSIGEALTTRETAIVLKAVDTNQDGKVDVEGEGAGGYGEELLGLCCCRWWLWVFCCCCCCCCCFKNLGVFVLTFKRPKRSSSTGNIMKLSMEVVWKNTLVPIPLPLPRVGKREYSPFTFP